jgi:GT2 family glycosyltransferase
MTMMCVDYLHNLTNYPNKEIIVVDDGSPEDRFSRIWKIKYPDIKVIRKEINEGFAKTVNAGIKESTGDMILLLNNDTIVGKDTEWLNKMVKNIEDKNIHMTAPSGAKLNSKWQYVAGEVKTANEKFQYLPGWCLLIKREVLDKIGYFPEDFGRGYWEDTLFCYRAKKAGFKLGITEGVGITHYFHTTFNCTAFNSNNQYHKNRDIFIKLATKEGLVYD